ncbi:MAG: hypothetical protein NC307_10540 [Roseburia sp.]|nr:hypothetical protein [Roseburia sp.]
MPANYTLQRTEQFLLILRKTIEQNPISVEDILYQEGREQTGEWKDFAKGTFWGKNNAWYHFRTEFTIPEEYAGKCVKCKLSTGREGAWNALNLIDGRVPSSEAYFASLQEASEYMRHEFYEKFCGHEEVMANCVGHTHIDVAWQAFYERRIQCGF